MLRIFSLLLCIGIIRAAQPASSLQDLPDEIKFLMFSNVDHFDIQAGVRKQMALKIINKDINNLINKHKYKKHVIKEWSHRKKLDERLIAYYLHENPAELEIPLINEPQLLDVLIKRFDNSKNSKRIMSALLQDIGDKKKAAEKCISNQLNRPLCDNLLTLHHFLYNSAYAWDQDQLNKQFLNRLLTHPPLHTIATKYQDATLLIAASYPEESILKISYTSGRNTPNTFGLVGNLEVEFENKPEKIIPQRIFKQHGGSIIVQRLYSIDKEISFFIIRFNSRGSCINQYIKPCLW